MVKRCRECKGVFFAQEDWNTTCICCWKESKEMDLLGGDRQVREFQALVEKLQEELLFQELKQALPTTLKGKKLKDLIFLCHPDKHQDSKKAKEVTQWLLEQRGK
jgi:hypothetical protein